MSNLIVYAIKAQVNRLRPPTGTVCLAEVMSGSRIGEVDITNDGVVVLHTIDGIPLEDPITVEVDPSKFSLPSVGIQGRAGTTWYGRNTLSGPALEPDKFSIDQWAPKSATHYMVCACGNMRFASRNNIAQIDRCKPCTVVKRRSYRAQWQRGKREVHYSEREVSQEK